MSSLDEDEVLEPLWKSAFRSVSVKSSPSPPTAPSVPTGPVKPALLPFLQLFHGDSGGSNESRLVVACVSCKQLLENSNVSMHSCRQPSLSTDSAKPSVGGNGAESNEVVTENNGGSEDPPVILGPAIPHATLRASIPFEYEAFPSTNGRFPGEEEALRLAESMLGPELFEDACAEGDLVKRAVRGQVAKGAEASEVAGVLQDALEWKAALSGGVSRQEQGDSAVKRGSEEGSRPASLISAEGFKALGPRGERFLGELWPTRLCGPDRFGHPVVLERVGEVKPELIEAEGYTPREVALLRGFVMECVAIQTRRNSQARVVIASASASAAAASPGESSAASSSASPSVDSTSSAKVSPLGEEGDGDLSSSTSESTASSSLPLNVEPLPYQVCQAVWVFDMGDLNMTYFSAGFKNVVMAAAEVASKVYLDTVFCIYVVNAPLLFRVLWALATKAMSPITIAKVQVLGSASEAAATLEEEIGLTAKRRPSWLGGTALTEQNHGGDGWASAAASSSSSVPPQLPTATPNSSAAAAAAPSVSQVAEEEAAAEAEAAAKDKSGKAQPSSWCADGEAALVVDLVKRWDKTTTTRTTPPQAFPRTQTVARGDDQAHRFVDTQSRGSVSTERNTEEEEEEAAAMATRKAKLRAFAERVREIDEQLRLLRGTTDHHQSGDASSSSSSYSPEQRNKPTEQAELRSGSKGTLIGSDDSDHASTAAAPRHDDDDKWHGGSAGEKAGSALRPLKSPKGSSGLLFPLWRQWPHSDLSSTLRGKAKALVGDWGQQLAEALWTMPLSTALASFVLVLAAVLAIADEASVIRPTPLDLPPLV